MCWERIVLFFVPHSVMVKPNVLNILMWIVVSYFSGG